MKYKVLYRKYRPDDFKNIVGQDYIIKTLKNSIINNNISHAYIFSGPRGTGKTSTAKVFAKAINCLHPVDGSPCGECEFCLNFQENPDIIEIDAASNNGVDEIRNLIDNIKLTPTNGKYKVYIIDEVHMLTTSAFNALLLTLEEPPSHSIFILATTNIENVPITILSRCQRFDFQKITIDNLVNRLTEICNIEQIKIDEYALTEIAYLSEGGMRDALSLLDQLSKSKEKITLEFIENNIKSISNKSINDLVDSIENNDINKCLELINDCRIRAVDYKNLIKKLIDVLSKKAKKIKQTGKYKRLNFSEFKSLILNLADSISKVNVNIDAYTILEMILLEYIETEPDSTININQNDENNSKIETENYFPGNILKESIKEIDDDLVGIRINNCFVGAQKQALEDAKMMINKYLASINISGEIKAVLEDSAIVAASNTNWILSSQNDHVVNKANKILNKIESSLQKEFNNSIKLIFITDERWKLEKEKYIQNLKNKQEYKYIEEKEINNDDTQINDVFDISKVEII